MSSARAIGGSAMTPRRLLGVLVAAASIAAGGHLSTARADVDLTGDWVLLGSAGGAFTSFRQFTQTGTGLEVRGGNGVLTGTVDPATGVFSVEGMFVILFAQCGELITGVASGDGSAFAGDYYFACPSELIFIHHTIEGHRCGTPGVSCCGNGLIDGDEVCDGDCCLACQALAPGGSACTTDRNPCTDDVCDGGGRCQHVDNTAPCTLSGACDPAGVCSNGACRPTPCRAATVSRLSVRSVPRLGTFPVRWTWRGVPGGSVGAVFGDPTRDGGATEYSLCFEVPTSPGYEYTERAAYGVATGSAYWTGTSTGYRLQSPHAAVPRMKLRATARDARFQASTELIGPLPVAGPAHFRLVSKDLPGACFEATFTTPGVNTADRYRAQQ